MGNRLDSSSKLAPPASWARVPAAWLWSRQLTEPPRPCSVREPGGSKWAVWEAFCGMQGRFRTFSFILTWQSQKSTHFITQKEKVGAFFSQYTAYAVRPCIYTRCINVYARHALLHISYLSIHITSTAPNAAVDTHNMQETVPNLQAEPSQQHRTRQTPAALRERGSGGEALLSEKRPLPSVPLCITLLNLLFSQSCPHVEKSGDFGFSTGWYSQAVERVKSGAKLENLGKKWGKSAEIFEKGKWKKEGIKRHGREYR